MRWLSPRLASRVLIAVTVAALIAGCEAGGESGEIGAGVPTHSWNYTLSSNAGNMPAGSRVIVVYAVSSDASCTFTTADFFHIFDQAVTTADQIQVTYSQQYTVCYWASIYLDEDHSDNLTPGDMVWGTDPHTLYGEFVLQPFYDTSDTVNKDWEDVGTKLFGGFTTYSGPQQSY